MTRALTVNDCLLILKVILNRPKVTTSDPLIDCPTSFCGQKIHFCKVGDLCMNCSDMQVVLQPVSMRVEVCSNAISVSISATMSGLSA